MRPVEGFGCAETRLDAAMLEALQADDPEGIPHWQLHDLRRTCASKLAELRVLPHVTEAVFNHASGAIKGVAAVYNRCRHDDEKRAAPEAWGRDVERLATGETVSSVAPLHSAAE